MGKEKIEIYTVKHKKEEEFLRKSAADFDFSKYSKKEVNELIKNMRMIMKAADGVGLSANQIGLDMKVFVAQVESKFYAIFNPKLTRYSDSKDKLEEGCLSVPKTFGLVERPTRVVLEGLDKNGKKIKIKAWGFLARVFQHEVDHLEGKLFTDRI